MNLLLSCIRFLVHFTLKTFYKKFKNWLTKFGSLLFHSYHETMIRIKALMVELLQDSCLQSGDIYDAIILILPLRRGYKSGETTHFIVPVKTFTMQ